MKDVGTTARFAGKAEQPIETDLKFAGHGGNRVRTWKSVVLPRQQLRERRAIDTNFGCKTRGFEAGTRHGLAQPVTEDERHLATLYGPLSFIHHSVVRYHVRFG